MKYKAIIHDLDGTLVDSKKDIVRAVNVMVQKFDRPPLSETRIHQLVGTGADDLVRQVLPGLSDAELMKAYEGLLNDYCEHCLEETRIQPFVLDGLQEFCRRGMQQAVWTNKPHNITKAVIEGLGLGPYFTIVLGAENGFPHKPNPDGTRYVLQQLEVLPAEALMIGDSPVDFETARNVGMDCVLVMTGYSPRDELLKLKEKERVVGVFEDYREVLKCLNVFRRRRIGLWLKVLKFI
jgi:phosphoglycolate phosphatase